jgi:hypothetical protein
MLPLPHITPAVVDLVDLYTSRPGTIHRILYVALQEWSYFGGTNVTKGHRHTGHKETEKGFYQRIGTYWKYGTGTNLTGKDTDFPWSAAFISFVMRTAGVTHAQFPGATAHSRYIHFALQNRVHNTPGAAFVGRRLTEYKPKVGDLVCTSREGANMTFDKAIKQKDYTSHCDIVVYVWPGEIGTIGGNVSDSVAMKILKIGAGGFLTDKTAPWFAILENRLPLK